MTGRGDAAPRRRSGFRALRHPAYRLYFIHMLLRGSAVWTVFVVLPWYLVSVGAGPGEVGLIGALLYLPVFVMAALGGVLADRVNRARLLVSTQILSGAVAAALAWLTATGVTDLAPFAACALVLGTLVATELPVRQSYLTELVPTEDVTSAVSLHATAWNTTRFLGPGIAGLVIVGPGVPTAFALAAVTALVVAVFVAWGERVRTERSRWERSRAGVVDDLVAGFRFSLTETRIRWALLFIVATSVFGIMTFQTLAPVFAKDELGLAGDGYGGFLAAWGVGGVVASYVVTALARGDRTIWLVGGSLGFSVLSVGLAAVELVPLAFVLSFCLGAVQIAVVQNCLVIVQRATPDAMRGRVSGVYVMAYQGSNPFGAAFAGILAEQAGVRPTLAVAAAVLAFVAVAGGLALRRARAAAAGAPP